MFSFVASNLSSARGAGDDPTTFLTRWCSFSRRPSFPALILGSGWMNEQSLDQFSEVHQAIWKQDGALSARRAPGLSRSA